jgi:hypothetical protein
MEKSSVVVKQLGALLRFPAVALAFNNFVVLPKRKLKKGTKFVLADASAQLL